MTDDTCHMYASPSTLHVALTFDDGPNPPVADAVLDILPDANVKATFFCIGRWTERWLRTARRIHEGGHEIGNHTYLHRWGAGNCEEAKRVIGEPTRFAGAPAFDYDSCGQSEFLRSGRLTLIDSDVNPSDWDSTDPDEIAQRGSRR